MPTLAIGTDYHRELLDRVAPHIVPHRLYTIIEVSDEEMRAIWGSIVTDGMSGHGDPNRSGVYPSSYFGYACRRLDPAVWRTVSRSRAYVDSAVRVPASPKRKRFVRKPSPLAIPG